MKGYESLDMTKISDAYELVDEKYSTIKTNTLEQKVVKEPFSVQISKVSLSRS